MPTGRVDSLKNCVVWVRIPPLAPKLKGYKMDRVSDRFDNELKVGDFITYPCRSGSSMWLNEARIVDIKLYSDFYRGIQPMLIVEVPTTKSSYDKETRKYIHTPCMRKTTIYCLGRVTLLEGMSKEKVEKDFLI